MPAVLSRLTLPTQPSVLWFFGALQLQQQLCACCTSPSCLLIYNCDCIELWIEACCTDLQLQQMGSEAMLHQGSRLAAQAFTPDTPHLPANLDVGTNSMYSDWPAQLASAKHEQEVNVSRMEP